MTSTPAPPPRHALYAGSFDPLTLGHMDLIHRGLTLFDQVTVAVARNINKRPLLSFEERVELIERAFAQELRVRVAPLPEGLLVRFARDLGAQALLRGLRGAADLEYEQQLASMNRALAPEVESVFLMSSERHRFVSSSLVRDVALNGGDVRPFVPEGVAEALAARLASGRGAS